MLHPLNALEDDNPLVDLSDPLVVELEGADEDRFIENVKWLRDFKQEHRMSIASEGVTERGTVYIRVTTVEDAVLFKTLKP